MSTDEGHSACLRWVSQSRFILARSRSSKKAMKLKLIALLTLVRLASFSQSRLPDVEFRNVPPDLNLILQSMERAKRQNRDSARPYEVTRQYKVFRGDDKQPTSEVTAQIRFTPLSKKNIQDYPGERERKRTKDSARSFGTRSRDRKRRSQQRD